MDSVQRIALVSENPGDVFCVRDALRALGVPVEVIYCENTGEANALDASAGDSTLRLYWSSRTHSRDALTAWLRSTMRLSETWGGSAGSSQRATS